MVADDSKVNLVFVIVIVFIALVIAGFALWIFFFSPEETLVEEGESINDIKSLFSTEEKPLE